MQTVTTIGLDIAKSVFQVHGVDGAGQVLIRRQLKRRYVLAFFQKLPPCLVGICRNSFWLRRGAVFRRPSSLLRDDPSVVPLGCRSRPALHGRPRCFFAVFSAGGRLSMASMLQRLPQDYSSF